MGIPWGEGGGGGLDNFCFAELAIILFPSFGINLIPPVFQSERSCCCTKCIVGKVVSKSDEPHASHPVQNMEEILLIGQHNISHNSYRGMHD